MSVALFFHGVYGSFEHAVRLDEVFLAQVEQVFLEGIDGYGFECVGNVAYFGRLFPFEKGEYLLLPGVEVDGRAGLCDRRYRGRCGLGGYVCFGLSGQCGGRFGLFGYEAVQRLQPGVAQEQYPRCDVLLGRIPVLLPSFQGLVVGGAPLFDEAVDRDFPGPLVAVLQHQQGGEDAREFTLPFAERVYGDELVGKGGNDDERVVAVMREFTVGPLDQVTYFAVDRPRAAAVEKCGCLVVEKVYRSRADCARFSRTVVLSVGKEGRVHGYDGIFAQRIFAGIGVECIEYGVVAGNQTGPFVGCIGWLGEYLVNQGRRAGHISESQRGCNGGLDGWLQGFVPGYRLFSTGMPGRREAIDCL